MDASPRRTSTHSQSHASRFTHEGTLDASQILNGRDGYRSKPAEAGKGEWRFFGLPRPFHRALGLSPIGSIAAHPTVSTPGSTRGAARGPLRTSAFAAARGQGRHLPKEEGRP